MNIDTFNKQIQNVIDWNAVARNLVHTFTDGDIKSQSDYVHEEAKETIAALATNNTVEVMDGSADIFVTMVYKYFLMRKEFSADFKPEGLTCEELTDPQMREDYLIFCASSLLTNNLYAASVADMQFTMDILYCFLETIEQWYGVDMHAIIDEVMVSNWSKFPIYQEGFDYEGTCRVIEQVRQRKNVAFTTVEVGGVVRVAFRDNFGNGKIMKPASFVEPNIASLL